MVAQFYGIMPQVKLGIEMRFDKRLKGNRFTAEELSSIDEVDSGLI